ncbi:response regulator transcription factor [Modestobacter marinus]|uniref:DNA-binding NarL/FixJ family response regulator n=1 Tax=Modestobacter marinus TaxID=477641 RepID=A0A846LL99_9ACTN|nr:response regulator transcription factor [Modestobacter marinus]NIH68267.1 DNA-binding NarL/FixJ family response regulator [Modestobacter marinus]GGL79068.1 DNA-binding response regulator [Modestobacter marinus]
MRVAIADDSPFFRQGLAVLLQSAGHDVVVLAADGVELLAELHAMPDRPDVVIIDVWMPPTHTDEGLVAAEQLHLVWPDLPVLLLSAHVQPSYATRLLAGGTRGRGLLSKDKVDDLGTLLDALTRLTTGGLVLDQDVVADLISQQRGTGELDRLSARERDVLRSMAEGRSNRSIAGTLHLSERTIEAHTASIFDKLGISAEGGDNRRVRAVLTWLRGHSVAATEP